MSLFKWTAILFIPVVLGIYFAFFGCCNKSPPVVPDLTDRWWGEGAENSTEKSSAIKPFHIKLTDDVLNDLKTRLQNSRIPESLQGEPGEVNFEYGFHSVYMKEVVEYWLNKFDWRKQEKLLNSYPQYMTNIEGIDVHFLHVKPTKPTANVRPLMLIHGWPGSVWEFYKIIPLLTSVNSGDVSLELIIPSIPGYGFSQAPHKRGFDAPAAARVFHKLMTRLGHDRFYVQGGDWGSGISQMMAKLYPSRVIGLHINMAPPPMTSACSVIRQLVASAFPSLIYSPAEMGKYKSMKDQFVDMWREFGYLHIQSTRPDSLAYGLNDSPVGLAAYILEKFAVWTNSDNRFCKDGCLTKHFTLDELLTEVMIYWTTGSIGSSVRFYKETMDGSQMMILESLPLKVPMAIAAFPHEIAVQVEGILRGHFDTLVQYTLMPNGGHFAAFEQPELLAEDVRRFVQLVEKVEPR